MAGGKLYKFEEVRKHTERNDCWLIISGKVYDVTPFMEEHPGGEDVLLASTGKDATTDYEDIGHSASATEMMHQYCIGDVDMASIPAKVTYAIPKEEISKKAPTTSTTGSWTTLLQLTAPLLLLALVFVLQSFAKAKTE
ncbi:hypothetical protein QOZ80_2BG0194900 [Eleusine coracana subsp. coracana]|nr:hypothetical protein QOZ80_2BG0194900 [Eleusine coracana subsp. coracana]